MNKDVVDKLYATMSKALPQPENRKRFETQGLDVVGARPEDLGKLMREETTRWAKVVKDSGAKVD
jgi:tripartite-type tricarboxylate transporter receptor subunit TctC